MVQAILQGRKTMTRRILKEQDIRIHPTEGWPGSSSGEVKCPYGKPGDILWVRETHYQFGIWQKRWNEEKGRDEMVFVQDPQFNETRFFDNPPAVIETKRKTTPGWYKRPSLFMPREACRLFLKITDVRVERLQDISEEDAKAEGVQENVCDNPKGCVAYNGSECCGKGEYFRYSEPMDFESEPCYSATESFQSLWESINGPESWEANPWVWAITFERTDKQ